MTGYFSQLAHHAGLSFEPNTDIAASRSATAPTVAAQHPESAPAAPPHVQEITFTAPAAPSAFEDNHEGLAGISPVVANFFMDAESAPVGRADDRNARQTESKDAGHPQSAAPTANTSIDVSPGTLREEWRIEFTGSESRTANPLEHSAEEESPAGEDRMVQSDARSDVERTREPQESIEVVEGPFPGHSRAQNRQALRRETSDQQLQPTRPREAVDAVRDEQMEREVIVHSYLKEVRAWVAASPEIDERALEYQRDVERPPRDRDVFALEREIDAPSLSRPGRPEAPEVQDLNLSIGTISIVIEEPKQNAPAPLQAPPRVERSPERTTSEPTRLSRYYLRSW